MSIKYPFQSNICMSNQDLWPSCCLQMANKITKPFIFSNWRNFWLKSWILWYIVRVQYWIKTNKFNFLKKKTGWKRCEQMSNRVITSDTHPAFCCLEIKDSLEESIVASRKMLADIKAATAWHSQVFRVFLGTCGPEILILRDLGGKLN